MMYQTGPLFMISTRNYLILCLLQLEGRVCCIMSIKLQTYPDGNIVAYPMTGFELRTAGETALLVVIEYVETPEQLESGERKTLQTTVLPQQALDFAETLKRSATLLLASDSGEQVN